MFGSEARSAPGDRSKREDIRRLMQVNLTLEHAQQVADLVATNLTRFARARRPAEAERIQATALQATRSVFAEHLDSLADRLGNLYDRHFTHDEVRAMIAFYESDLGRKSLRVMPELVTSSVQGMQAWAQALVPLIRDRIRTHAHDAVLDDA